jgi:hypothetical protein
MTLFIVAASIIPKTSGLKETPSRGGFWQMSCPHGYIGVSLNIWSVGYREVKEAFMAKSKKMGKFRNPNRSETKC